MRTSALIPLQGRRRLSGRNYAALIPRSVQPLQRSGGTSLVRSHPIPSPIQRRSYHPSITLLSDNLLGYSPMAQSLPKSNDTGKQKSAQSPSQGAIWGVDSNTAGGGVWAQSSAKKDKLNELLTDLNGEGIDTGKLGMESLDLAATPEQKLDLQFADGLKYIAKCVDQDLSVVVNDSSSTDSPILKSMHTTSQKTQTATQQILQMLSGAVISQNEWTRPKFEATMKEAIRVLSSALPIDPTLQKPTAGSLDTHSSLCYIRDFVVEKDNNNDTSSDPDIDQNMHDEMEALNQITTHALSTSIHIYKALLLRAVAITLIKNWDSLTSITSGDIDRAAVNHDGSSPIPSQRDTVSAQSIQQIFQAYESASCHQFVESWWNIMDADCDGLIDQEEMNVVVNLAMKPVHMALKEMVDLSLEVCPSRRVGMRTDGDAWFLGGDDTSSLNNKSSKSSIVNKISWRNRRTELAARKQLTKIFSSTLARHFRDQVETPHRLRCIYAWAEKSHQNNKIDSILVDASEEWGAASSIVGRKRYVELEPKISYDEFRDVQRKHFPQLDAMGEEIIVSFKEDLWVAQGKMRQNAELRRDCFLFLAMVSLIDAGIGLL